jgi:DNA-binding XRE family transcriptional regulator
MTTNLDASEFLEKLLGPLTFGNFMKISRENRELNQTQMAKFLKVSKSTLCDIEKGRQLVSPALAAKIAKKCKMSVGVAVQLALQDQIRKAKLKYTVQLVKA